MNKIRHWKGIINRNKIINYEYKLLLNENSSSYKNNFDRIDIDPIEKYEINGDYIESQAFAFLAIRSVEGLPISFPSTTRCNEASTGGTSVENF